MYVYMYMYSCIDVRTYLCLRAFVPMGALMYECMYVRMYVYGNEYIYVCNVSMHVSNMYADIHA